MDKQLIDVSSLLGWLEVRRTDCLVRECRAEVAQDTHAAASKGGKACAYKEVIDYVKKHSEMAKRGRDGLEIENRRLK